MAIIGYARVSTTGQSLEGQVNTLEESGASHVVEETGSGGDKDRPALRKLLKSIRLGDILLVVRIDRLARSVSHLLEVIEELEGKGAGFRSLGDPVDTTTAQGKFTLQILGAVAEFERALIRERTMAGLATAKKAGRIGGNPKLRARDPEALKTVGKARDDRFFDEINEAAAEWLPIVRRMRPESSWKAVSETINRQSPAPSHPWSPDRVKRATLRFIKDGLLDGKIMARAPKSQPSDRIATVVAGMINADPKVTLKRIGSTLEHMRERTPSGKDQWSLSSVKMLRDRAARLGLIVKVNQ
jgi:DNA invertase Pin-like site-specific DNA recombinase